MSGHRSWGSAEKSSSSSWKDDRRERTPHRQDNTWDAWEDSARKRHGQDWSLQEVARWNDSKKSQQQKKGRDKDKDKSKEKENDKEKGKKVEELIDEGIHGRTASAHRLSPHLPRVAHPAKGHKDDLLGW